MKLKLSFPILALAAITLAASPNAFASNIDFSCTDGSGTGILLPSGTSPTALCNGTSVASTNTSTLTSWTQGVFNVAPTTGNWVYNPNQGNPSPNVTQVLNGGTMTITDGGGLFDFNSLQYSGTGLASYSIIGMLGATQEFDITCSSGCSTASGVYNTILAGGYGSDNINSLSISVNGGVVYVDNIGVTATPEPNGLLLLGSGMLAIAFLVRRKLFS
jgi:hypothetical protein